MQDARRYIYRTPREVEVRIRKLIKKSESFDDMISAIAGYVSLYYVKVGKKKRQK